MASSHSISRVRNLGVAAHIDAGKTTVTERMLYYSGLIHRMGTVDDGNTTTDFLPEERERGITIQSAAVTIPWHDHHINIIDTPGHVDFTAEVERSLRVLDGAVIVFCGSGGVEAQSETVWRQANRYGVARIAFVNKLDRIGADFDRVVDEIRTRLNGTPLQINFPNGTQEDLKGVVDLIRMKEMRFDPTGKTAEVEYLDLEGELFEEAETRRAHLIEETAEVDDELATAFLEGREISQDELKAAIRRATLAGSAQPVFCGAALRNVGVQPLMDAVVDYLPSPRDMRETKGFDPESEKEMIRKNYPDQPFSALIFKTVTDAHGELSFMRVYSGTAKEGERVLNTRKSRKEKLGRLYVMFADERKAVKEATAGDIVAALGLKFSTTGDTLAAANKPIAYERLTFPEPVVSMAVEPRTNADREKLMVALERLSRDDPTFFTHFDEETGQQIIAGMGELHLEVRVHELINEHSVKIKVGEPRVSYREGLRGRGVASVIMDDPLGGQAQYAEVTIEVEDFPNDQPGHVVFESSLSPEALPKEFLEAIDQAARDAAGGGVLRGDPMINIRIRLTAATLREGESTAAAFARATAMAFSEAARKADPVLLEPIMSFEVVTPEEFLGGVLKDLQMRGAEVGEMSVRDDRRAICGRVALSRMFQYASVLRSLSQGRGACSLEPSTYGEVSRQDYVRLVGE